MTKSNDNDNGCLWLIIIVLLFVVCNNEEKINKHHPEKPEIEKSDK